MEIAAEKIFDADVLVLGAGVNGLVAAIALGQEGFRTALAGVPDLREIGRTVALFDGSVQLMRNLGLWDAIASHAAPLDVMRIVDDTGSLFALPPVEFAAAEIGLPQFGFNVALAPLIEVLAAAAERAANVSLHRAEANRVTYLPQSVEVATADGRVLAARLLAGADGRDSLARRRAGVAVAQWSYPQVALTAVLAHRAPHSNISTEFQTREGPCTLVPMLDAPDGQPRSSLVWLMREDKARHRAALEDREFAMAVQRQTKFLLGAMQVEGGRGQIPMRGLSADSCIAPRLALLGEAAHVFPPIGAQGLNLGLRDVADLVDCLTQGRASGDAGAPAALRRYALKRQGDIASRSLVVDALNRSLLTPLLPVDFLRGAGMAALAHVGPLRRAVMRAGVQPRRVPPLMLERGRRA